MDIDIDKRQPVGYHEGMSDEEPKKNAALPIVDDDSMLSAPVAKSLNPLRHVDNYIDQDQEYENKEHPPAVPLPPAA